MSIDAFLNAPMTILKVDDYQQKFELFVLFVISQTIDLAHGLII